MQDEQLICECELIGRSKLEETLRRRETTILDDIRRSLRLGMGPCQGGFCIYRATGIEHGLDGIDGANGVRVAARLPPGALEGDVADPLRRPVAAGAARRLDLPGAARRGAPAVIAVVGAGLAGLVAAVRLAEGGERVIVLAKGVGGTHLSPCTIDVLGYAPDRVTNPLAALDRLARGPPATRSSGRDGIVSAAAWWQESMPYVGSLEENLLLPTAVGALKPSALVPETMAARRRGGARSASSASAR